MVPDMWFHTVLPDLNRDTPLSFDAEGDEPFPVNYGVHRHELF